jgi:hypothetical protein
MELSILLFKVIQAFGISLGVGASTMAITNFFYAIADGIIDERERNFLGVNYIVLRVAMGIILVTSLITMVMGYFYQGDAYFTPYVAAQAILTAVLFVNALLMTIKVMPSTFGPAIQAGSWYTLGFMAALYSQGFNEFNFLVFVLGYISFVIFAITLVNAIMAYLKDRREASNA